MIAGLDRAPDPGIDLVIRFDVDAGEELLAGKGRHGFLRQISRVSLTEARRIGAVGRVFQIVEDESGGAFASFGPRLDMAKALRAHGGRYAPGTRDPEPNPRCPE